jgi:hypothetical protein
MLGQTKLAAIFSGIRLAQNMAKFRADPFRQKEGFLFAVWIYGQSGIE